MQRSEYKKKNCASTFQNYYGIFRTLRTWDKGTVRLLRWVAKSHIHENIRIHFSSRSSSFSLRVLQLGTASHFIRSTEHYITSETLSLSWTLRECVMLSKLRKMTDIAFLSTSPSHSEFSIDFPSTLAIGLTHLHSDRYAEIIEKSLCRIFYIIIPDFLSRTS